MARTEEAFAKAMQQVRDFTSRHDKPVWLVPTMNSYEISVFELKPESLPIGTRANLYDPDLEIMAFVNSTN